VRLRNHSKNQDLGQEIVPSLIRPLALKFDHINGPRVPVGLEQAIEASFQALEGVVGRSQS
jgi:hypothetical protein